MTTPSIIKSVHIYTNGDPGVGIPGDGVTIQADGDFLIDLEALDPADRQSELNAFREKLKDAFAVIWTDEPAKVVFDFELAEEE